MKQRQRAARLPKKAGQEQVSLLWFTLVNDRPVDYQRTKDRAVSSFRTIRNMFPDREVKSLPVTDKSVQRLYVAQMHQYERRLSLAQED